jgi:hypothetical protein
MMLAHFEGALGGIRYTSEDRAAFEESVVADLRVTTSRYARDPRLDALIERLRRGDRFRDLWSRGAVAPHHGTTKVIEHPDVGDIVVCSDTLITQGSDLRVVVCSAVPGTDARSKLDLLGAIGRQHITFPAE